MKNMQKCHVQLDAAGSLSIDLYHVSKAHDFSSVSCADQSVWKKGDLQRRSLLQEVTEVIVI